MLPYYSGKLESDSEALRRNRPPNIPKQRSHTTTIILGNRTPTSPNSELLAAASLPHTTPPTLDNRSH